MSLESSQSPQANRGSSQDYERFSRGSVEDGLHLNQRVSPENGGGDKVESDLEIEAINKRADRI